LPIKKLKAPGGGGLHAASPIGEVSFLKSSWINIVRNRSQPLLGGKAAALEKLISVVAGLDFC
jgi:hypothetical protein